MLDSAEREAHILADAQNAVRDLVNTPAGDLRTVELAAAAVNMAQGTGIVAEVWDEERLTAEGCGGLLGVGAGSASPSRMVRLTWEPEGAERSVALVGKGITFDSGGLSLKTATGMPDMKHDMSGAAAVFGAMRAIAKLELPIHVVGILAAAENMPSANAYRPSDIIKTVPEGYLLGDRALYLASFNKVREAIALDGMIPDEGARTALRALASFEPSVKADKVELAKTYTNEFARRAKDRYKA